MEAATAAKLEAEKRKHENALRYLDDKMREMRERLRQVRFFRCCSSPLIILKPRSPATRRLFQANI